MTLYSKLFNTHSEYEAYKNGQNYILPNISICYQDLDVHYEKYVRDYSKEYMTFEAIEDTEFSIVFTYDSIINQYITQAMRESFSYSVDDGETWVTFETPNDTYSGIALTTPTIHAGEKVLWKGIGTQNQVPGPRSAYCYFTSSGGYIAYGNMMSIIYGDMFINKYDLENTNYSFSNFFYNNSYLISAQNLILPATTLVDDCYDSMFYGCTSLTTAPELPATTLTNGCYSKMFYDCTSLTTAPELPATTLTNACYSNMFNGCMSLTTAPELPATTLTAECYIGMFRNCSSLTAAPELPATTLARTCYNSMFSGCTGLTTAPELPATTLVSSCYNSMFSGCSNLNYIKAMFTTAPSSEYTNDWLSGVSATGTFVKNSAATWTTDYDEHVWRGTSGVPSDWTVQTASA